MIIVNLGAFIPTPVPYPQLQSFQKGRGSSSQSVEVKVPESLAMVLLCFQKGRIRSYRLQSLELDGQQTGTFFVFLQNSESLLFLVIPMLILF